MLDEECMLPGGSDSNYCARITSGHLKNCPTFSTIKTKKTWFTIHHFAGPVHYNTDGFLDKNRNQLSLDVQDALKESENSFISNLFTRYLSQGSVDTKKTTKGSGDKKKPTTVLTEFRNQLEILMTNVEKTAPHFIRCIKPNPENQPHKFHRKSVAEQLQYAGVLQAVQVGRAGFPVREGHRSCYLEYCCLMPRTKRIDAQIFLKFSGRETDQHDTLDDSSDHSPVHSRDPSDSRTILTDMMECLDEVLEIPRAKFGDGKPSWAVGKTMVFLKHEAYEIMSTKLSQLRQTNSLKIQAHWKMHYQRNKYLTTQSAVDMIYYNVKIWLAKRKLKQLRENRAASIITKFFRITGSRNRLSKIRRAIIKIQAAQRRKIAQNKLVELRRNKAATTIQAEWKMFKEKKIFALLRFRIIIIQHAWRIRQAKRQLRYLKAKAKDTATLTAQKQAIADKLINAQKELTGVKGDLDSTMTQLAAASGKLLVVEKELEATQHNLLIAQQGLQESLAEIESNSESYKALQSAYNQLKNRHEELTKEHWRQNNDSENLLPDELNNLKLAYAQLQEAHKQLQKANEALVYNETPNPSSPQHERASFGDSTPNSMSSGAPEYSVTRSSSGRFTNQESTGTSQSPRKPQKLNSDIEIPPYPHSRVTDKSRQIEKSDSKRISAQRKMVQVGTSPIVSAQTPMGESQMTLECSPMSDDTSSNSSTVGNEKLSRLKEDLKNLTETLGKIEITLAEEKLHRHSAEEMVQAVWKPNTGDYFSVITSVFTLKDSEHELTGDVLLLGDVQMILNEVLGRSRLMHDSELNPEDWPKAGEDKWLEKRVFDIYERYEMVIPIRVVVLNPVEFKHLSEVNQERYTKHFR